MSISVNSCRRVAAGVVGAGTFVGALLGGAPSAQAAPAPAPAPPPAAVQVAGAPLDVPMTLGTHFAATDWRTAPLPQWGRHHWWRHHHWWHRWWWWW